MSRSVLAPSPELAPLAEPGAPAAPVARASPRRRRRHGGRRLAARMAVALSAVAGVAAAGYWAWPFLGYAVAPAGAWLLLLTAHVWWRPRQATRWAKAWLGTLAIPAASTGVLEMYAPGWGGVAGKLMAGPTMAIGVMQLSAIGLVGAVVIAPRPAWRLASGVGRLAWLIARNAARLAPGVFFYTLAFGRAVGTGFRLAALGAWIALRAFGRALAALGRAYGRRPLHRPAIRGTWWVVAYPARHPPSKRRGPKPAPRPEGPAPLLALAPPRSEARPTTAARAWEVVSQDAPPVAEPMATPTADPARPERPADPIAASPHRTTIVNDRPTASSHGAALGGGLAGWSPPSLSILKSGERRWVSESENRKTAELIERALGEYGIEVNVAEIRPGPVVTQYGLVPGWVRRHREVKDRNPDGSPVLDERGKARTSRVEEKTRVKVDHILAREKDLALTLAASSIRFEAPVPGESFVGLEVPNAKPATVSLRSLLESDAFRALQRKARLPVALGQGSGGEPIVADLADMPHLLIAGATGSGKSVCLNTVICSLIMQLTPLEVQIYMVDPKRVELTPYSGLPHLAGPVLVEAEQAVPVLQTLIREMRSRYKRFEAAGVRNIQAFNGKAAAPADRIPYLILVIDELADLMMTAPSDVEQSLCRLAQLGRATGIHLVVATQRPSVDVLTGLIKANFPSRISFAVASQVDSRTILDGVGAEKLLGRGDMLFLPSDAPKPKRLQGAFISDDEVQALVSHWQRQRGPVPVAPAPTAAPEPEAEPADDDLRRARDMARGHTRISASLLQRKLGLGYAKAASLLDHLEEMGVVGPGDPGKSRTVIPGD